MPRLRRVSRIKSVQSSLAIENNTLTLEQVTDVLNGKKVLGPQEDIRAVKNAFESYKRIENINPFSMQEFLEVHKIMMSGLVDESGELRTTNVCVFDESGKIVYKAPFAQNIPTLMTQLFNWLRISDVQMLIKSSIFHYELEYIHPFRDGNGRMGRLWQTALLSSWKPIFKWIPIESIIKDNQEEYYYSIQKSTNEMNCNEFILFMLKVIKSAINDIINNSRNHYNHLNMQIFKLMQVMEEYPQTANQIMDKLKLKSRVNFRKKYLDPAIEAGLIAKTIPDKPTSKNQMYFKL